MSSPMVKRILLTNDDGIDAPGLATLLEVAQALAEEVWVVAPAFDQSGVATCISLHDPLRIATLGEKRYSVTGTPADCVTIGIRHLMKETPPDLVLSGINRGANLGAETFYSGTVGAALTALTLGVPALALSQAFSDGKAVRWNTAGALAVPTIRKLHELGWPAHVVLNINFPDVAAEAAKPLIASRQGQGALDTIDVIQRTDMRDLSYYWLKIRRSPHESDTLSETHLLDEGHITVSPIGFERTDEAARQALSTQLG